MTPESGAKTYLEKLRKQISCYEEILEISKKQKELLDEGCYNYLPQRVKEREKILTKLDILEYVITAYSDYWRKVVTSVEMDLNIKIANSIDKLHSVIHELEKNDKELKTASTSEMKRIKQEIAILRSNKVKTRAFRKPIFKPEPRYINRISKAQ